MKRLLIIAGIAAMFASCTKHTYVVNSNDDSKSRHSVTIGYPKNTEEQRSGKVRLPELTGGTNESAFLPNATAFRMNGNYSNNVAITVSPSGELLYFPAPTDITADSEPIELGDGWWLNNQGLGPNSVFTKYTFAEYAALPEVPSVEQLKLSIIPNSKVTGFMELPMKIGEANSDLEAAKAYVKGR